MKNPSPFDNFMGILTVKKGNVESICKFIIFFKKKNVQCHNLVGMGFDGTEIFAPIEFGF